MTNVEEVISLFREEVKKGNEITGDYQKEKVSYEK